MSPEFYGASAPERGWTPSPTYILRRDRILKALDGRPVGRVLEIGCGAGGILNDLATRGFECEALEMSSAAREVARYVNRANENVHIHEAELSSWTGSFDYVMAFEVLEHIQDDRGALEKWRQYLKPQGALLISVPAHQRRWNASDVWAGHVRRYDRADLLRVIQSAGFEIEVFDCYGFPAANVIEPVRARVHAKSIRQGGKDAAGDEQQRINTERSGIERSMETRLFPLLNSFLGRLAMRLCLLLQASTSRSDWGTGYLVLARRRD